MKTQDQGKSYLSQVRDSADFQRYLLMELIDIVKHDQIEEIAEEYVKRSADSEGPV